MGIHKVETLSKIPVELLTNLMGKPGMDLHRKANGIDESPVIPFHEAKSISTEQTFQQDTIDLNFLNAQLVRMTEKIAFQLRQENKLTGCITVKIRYSDFDTRTLQARIPYTAADHRLVPKALEMFEQLYDRRVLVRLVGVRYSHLVGGGMQMDLFDADEDRQALYRAMDGLRERFGDRTIVSAASLGARTIGRTNPFSGDAPLLLANRHQ